MDMANWILGDYRLITSIQYDGVNVILILNSGEVVNVTETPIRTIAALNIIEAIKTREDSITNHSVEPEMFLELRPGDPVLYGHGTQYYLGDVIKAAVACPPYPE